jgi:cytosine/adenosine deaminase-related metal-dependent hydrolase
MSLVAWRADWIVPVIGPPVRDGLLVAEGGRIVHVGAAPDVETLLEARAASGVPIDRRTLGRVALLPPLVNAHTHLELSWAHGRLGGGRPMTEWVQQLVATRTRERPDEVAASELGIRLSLQCGTGVVGDVSNSLASCGPLARSPLRAVVFHELLGFSGDAPAAQAGAAADRARAAQAPNVDVTLAAHAPYSVSPALFREIACAVDDLEPGLTAVHLAESLDEMQFLRDGSGPWRALLERVGTWTDTWVPPRCGPVEYLARVGFLRRGLVVAHGVHLDAPAIAALAEAGATVVTCPRSNARLGVGTAPVAAMLDAGVNVAIGTDSLASNDDLNVFADLAALHAQAPSIPPRQLIEIATVNGARALRVDGEHGTMAPGRRADLVTVALDGPVDDVEEVLVSGIATGRIGWVRA